MKYKPGYYAIIPASVRYDKEIPANAKLIYGEIGALCNQEGFCWATNNYFAKLYDIKPKRVSELIAMLVKRGYINLDMDSTSGSVRHLHLADPLLKNKDTPPEKKGYPPLKNKDHNNTSNNNKTNTYVRALYELYVRLFVLGYTLDYKPTEEELSIGTKKYKLTEKRRQKIAVRLKDDPRVEPKDGKTKFDVNAQTIAMAVVGYSREGWFIGENNRGWVADLADYICRSEENVEKGVNLYEDQKKGNSGDAWAGL